MHIVADVVEAREGCVGSGEGGEVVENHEAGGRG